MAEDDSVVGEGQRKANAGRGGEAGATGEL